MDIFHLYHTENKNDIGEYNSSSIADVDYCFIASVEDKR